MIADITDAKVVLEELLAVVTQLRTLPIQPILEAGAEMNSMVGDFVLRPNFIKKIYQYRSIEDLKTSLATRVIAPAEARRDKLGATQASFLAKNIRRPASTPQ
jgi:hypothetical protein